MYACRCRFGISSGHRRPARGSREILGPSEFSEIGAAAGPASDGPTGVYGITVAAELAGMSVQALRLYERKGLLEPTRTAGGTRRYSDTDIARLRRIGVLINDGINLTGIARVLGLEADNAGLAPATPHCWPATPNSPPAPPPAAHHAGNAPDKAGNPPDKPLRRPGGRGTRERNRHRCAAQHRLTSPAD